MANTPSPQKPAVLLLDDNRDAVDMLAKVLQLQGYEAIATYDVRTALDTLDRRQDVQTIVADIRMPQVDGFDFMRVVKVRYPTIPVILVSGHEITADDVVPAGAKILKKPLDIPSLLNLLPQLR